MRTGVLLCLGWGLVACGTSPSTGDVSGELAALQARIEALESANQALSLKLAEHENLFGQGETWSGVIGSRLDTLEAKTASLSQQEVNGQPALIISGVNVHLQNGEGSTNAVNARGNLIIGYQEEAPAQDVAGSHNLVVGEGHLYPAAAYGGVVFGSQNRINGAFAAVTGGANNAAMGPASSVSGGAFNSATGQYASVSGGHGSYADGHASSVSGGRENVAAGPASSVSGGVQNGVSGDGAAISGGLAGAASGHAASISGGAFNVASGRYSTILAGRANLAAGEASAVSGGADNSAESTYSSITGGRTNLIDPSGLASTISGGLSIALTGQYKWAGGTFADP